MLSTVWEWHGLSISRLHLHLFYQCDCWRRPLRQPMCCWTKGWPGSAILGVSRHSCLAKHDFTLSLYSPRPDFSADLPCHCRPSLRMTSFYLNVSSSTQSPNEGMARLVGLSLVLHWSTELTAQHYTYLLEYTEHVPAVVILKPWILLKGEDPVCMEPCHGDSVLG